ncbi:hypothetical protein OE88DRAFT_1659219 [Heliocybe sulcata]|uniref:Uncharacterized protein n=1 Tax=Heliocybe sulcata TaxID=5364 RepID=A0A5C3N2P7_9AGAM|nr:hypothetical protein OE88DRAFT_1659219 [Heliocybe sulcata]
MVLQSLGSLKDKQLKLGFMKTQDRLLPSKGATVEAPAPAAATRPPHAPDASSNPKSDQGMEERGNRETIARADRTDQASAAVEQSETSTVQAVSQLQDSATYASSAPRFIHMFDRLYGLTTDELNEYWAMGTSAERNITTLNQMMRAIITHQITDLPAQSALNPPSEWVATRFAAPRPKRWEERPEWWDCDKICYVEAAQPNISDEPEASPLSLPAVVTPPDADMFLAQKKPAEFLVSDDDEIVSGGCLPLEARVIRPPTPVAHRQKLLRILNGPLAEIPRASAPAPAWYSMPYTKPVSAVGKKTTLLAPASIEYRGRFWRELAAPSPTMGTLIMPLAYRWEEEDMAALREVKLE